MRSAIERYAFPFFEGVQTIRDVYALLERFGGFYDMVVFQSALKYLLGEVEEASALLMQRRRRLEGVGGEKADILHEQSAALMCLLSDAQKAEEV